MNIGASIGHILKAAFVVGCLYTIVKWEFDESKDDGVKDIAEKACIDAIAPSDGQLEEIGVDLNFLL